MEVPDFVPVLQRLNKLAGENNSRFEGEKLFFDGNEKNVFCLQAIRGLQCPNLTTQQLWNLVYSLQTS